MNIRLDKIWLKNENCQSMEIKHFQKINGKESVEQTKVTDLKVIAEVIGHLKNLPTEGDIMISMGPPASYLTVDFHCGNTTSKIEFFDSLLKTPGTSFFANPLPAEKALLKLIKAQLAKN